MFRNIKYFFAILGLTALVGTSMAQDDGETYIVSFKGPSLAAAYGDKAKPSTHRTSETGRKKLDVNAPESARYLTELRRIQDQRVAEIASRTGRTDLQIQARFDVVLNGVALLLTDEQADQVRALPFVEFVEKERIYDLHTWTGPEWMNADAIWNGTTTPSGMPNRGEGMVIGVVDTGINTSGHASFAETSDDGYTHTNPLGSGNYHGDCIGGSSGNDLVPCNAKLIGAWAFTGTTPEDSESSVAHGSHTASISGGNYVMGPFDDVLLRTQTGNTFQDVPAAELSGVAPRANLVAYKACAGGCPGGALINSLQQSIIDGVDVVNYSIGPTDGRGSDPWTDATTSVMLDMVNAGIFVAASAGNTGTGNPNPEADVVNKGPWIMTVANSSHGGIVSNPFSITGPGTPPSSLVDIPALTGTGPGIMSDVSGDVVHSEDVDPGNFEGCNPWSGTPFAGSIALISRGTCNFSDKVDNADAAGAEAVVVYNNAGDNVIRMGGLEATSIPSVMIGQSDGLAVASFIDSNPGATSLLSSTEETAVVDAVGNNLSAGSLTGPNLDFDFTKPDITGPGTLIVAAGAQDTPADFHYLSGTSMSSPHLAGSAAIMMNEHPDWTLMEIKSAIMMTADSANNDADGNPANADHVGSGMPRLDLAVASGLLMHASHSDMVNAHPGSGGDPATLNFPSMRSTSCSPDCSWTRTVRNSLDVQASWTVGSATGEDFDVSVTPSNFELLPGDVIMRGSFETGSEPVSAYQTLTIDVTNNTSGNTMSFGEIILSEDSAAAPDARMTIAVSETLPPAPPL